MVAVVAGIGGMIMVGVKLGLPGGVCESFDLRWRSTAHFDFAVL